MAEIEESQDEVATETPNIHQRLLAVMGDLGALKKTGHMALQNYDYHAIDAVEDAIRPLLVKHGIDTDVFISSMKTETIEVPTKDGKTRNEHKALVAISVRFVNVDDPKDYTVGTSVGEGLDSRELAIGKAASYALKNLYLARFHLKGNPDNEGTVSADEYREELTPKATTEKKAEPKPAAPKSPPKPAAPQSNSSENGGDDYPSVVGVPENYSKKETARGGFRHSLKLNGEWYSTFSDTDGAVMEEASDRGESIHITYSTDGKFKNIKSAELSDVPF